MERCALFFLLLTFASAQTTVMPPTTVPQTTVSTPSEDCTNLQNQTANNGMCDNTSEVPCTDLCSNETISLANCSQATHCCVVNDTCILKTLNIDPLELPNLEDIQSTTVSTPSEYCTDLQTQTANDGMCDTTSEVPCTDLCSNETISLANCSQATHCCVVNDTCILKTLNIDPLELPNLEDIQSTTVSTPSEYCTDLQTQTANDGMCDTTSEVPCTDLCSNETISLANCSQATHCCVVNNACILKTLNIDPPELPNLEDIQSKFERLFPPGIKRRNLILNPPSRFPPIGTPFPTCYGGSTPTPSGGFPVILGFPGAAPPPLSSGIPFVPPGGNPFSLGGNPFDPYGQNPGNPYAPPPLFCPKFPNNCERTCGPPDFSALVDIPYCQRIPCSPFDPLLENDFENCIRQPGCAFDFELFQYRSILRQAVLPGVPVCHRAIRNPAFHRRAAEYAQQNGAWNPLLTKCLINEYKSEIFGTSPGCYMIGVLEYFGHCAKRAGWASITENECYLIGGCWRNGMCYYPLRIDGVKVRSSRDELYIENDPRFLYGLPECLPIASNAPGAEFLSNYHKCLAIGCAVNADRYTYWQNLYQAGSSLPSYLHPIYWGMIQSGKARPDNYQDIIQEIINLYTRPQPTFPNLSGLGAFPGSIPLSLDLSNNSSTDDNDNNNDTRPRNLFFPPSTGGGIPGFPSNLGGGISGFPPNLGGGIPGFPPNLGGGIPGFPPNLGGSIPGFPPNLGGGIPGFPPNLGGGIPGFPPNLGGGIPGFPPNLGGGIPGFPPNLGGSIPGFPPNLGGGIPGFPPNLGGGIPGFPPNLGGGIPGFPPNLGGGFPGFPSHIPCPYTKPRHPHLQPLTGKTDGCCEKPFCYIPREQLRTQYSGVSGYLTEWSEFEKCSVTCGGGKQKRTRECIGGNCNPNLKTEQTRRCNEKCCPFYGRWNNWSQCSATCGNGVQTRTRRCTCNGNNAECVGPAEQTRPCKICDCPTYVYTPWSDCDADCCDGLIRRTKSCSNPGNCQNVANVCHPQEETETCTVYCGSRTYTPRPTCDRQVCRWRYDPVCKRSDGSPGCCPPGQMIPIYVGNNCCRFG